MKHVLVIDDDEAVALTLSTALRRGGYDVATAADGKLGVAWARKQAFDLVITDLIMPNQDGIETIIALRRLRPDLKVMAISGGGGLLGTEYLARVVGNLGAIRFLTKPCTQDQLLSAVSQVLADAEPIR